MSKLLLIGPSTDKKNPSDTGGIVVLFEDLVTQCKGGNIDLEIIDTNKANYSNKVFAYLHILFSSILKIQRVTHVSLHGTANDYFLIAPFVVFLSKLFEKQVSLRKFAGNFDVIYDNSSNVKRRVIDYVLKKSDINFFETKYLVKKFKLQNKDTYWFPNVRVKPNVKREGEYQKKFIFLGQVKEEKGVKEILEVSNLLDNSYTFDIYGKLFENMEYIDFDQYKATYKSSLDPKDIQKTLCQYDVLVLPTFWKGEGYPGVIIEALSVGLPIIATNLKGIKEMINEKSSVLINPKNVERLKEAIESFNKINYTEKSSAALKQSKSFDSEVQTKLFLERIGIAC